MAALLQSLSAPPLPAQVIRHLNGRFQETDGNLLIWCRRGGGQPHLALRLILPVALVYFGRPLLLVLFLHG